eukprot:Nk52_evm1s593 gene=Nk52_evmTU1s593
MEPTTVVDGFSRPYVAEYPEIRFIFANGIPTAGVIREMFPKSPALRGVCQFDICGMSTWLEGANQKQQVDLLTTLRRYDGHRFGTHDCVEYGRVVCRLCPGLHFIPSLGKTLETWPKSGTKDMEVTPYPEELYSDILGFVTYMVIDGIHMSVLVLHLDKTVVTFLMHSENSSVKTTFFTKKMITLRRHYANKYKHQKAKFKHLQVLAETKPLVIRVPSSENQSTHLFAIRYLYMLAVMETASNGMFENAKS